MAPCGKLWGFPAQRQTKVILAAAAVAGLEIDTPHFEFRVTNKTPEFLAKFPLGKVPAFQDATGFTLVEGASIARYQSYLKYQLFDGIINRQARSLEYLDTYLASKSSGFLIADRMTLADIALAAATLQTGRTTCGTTERALYPNVFAHYEKVTSDQRVKAVFGEPEFLERALTYKKT
ncbi:hypothetical protein ID866_2437 [Astraeus odoratus]|nr:hypothetical protein ID866_2437 [Astraeus odoratus]